MERSPLSLLLTCPSPIPAVNMGEAPRWAPPPRHCPSEGLCPAKHPAAHRPSEQRLPAVSAHEATPSQALPGCVILYVCL